MKLLFHGAANEVTGSLHRLQVGELSVLMDCGLFQGHRAEATRKNREIPQWALDSHALFLSHAHIDHSGNIPTLVKRGFEGNIYCTPATRDLCSVMLRDSAMLQGQDARYLNRKRAKGEAPVEPLYDSEDAQRAINQMISLPWEREMMLSKHLRFSFVNSGHVLGSSMVVIDAEENGAKRRILFTGDLGRKELPLLKTPQLVEDVNVLMMESTYGDRVHADFSGTDKALAKIVNDTIGRGGRVYIPTFALERAQEVLFALERLHEAGEVPRVPIYIDSPLAISITEIYKLHPESLDPEVRERILHRNDPFSPPGLKYIAAVEDSIRLQDSSEPCIVIAGSGMCEGGRIVYHLRKALPDPKHSVVIVGFMAAHTLGRRLQERRSSVRVLGVERDVHAQVHKLEGLSAHADREDLIEFAAATARNGRLSKLVLVHGESEARESLAEALRERGVAGGNIVLPSPGDELELV